jgi:hypothetical protein
MDEPVFAGRLFKNDKNSWSKILIYSLFVIIPGLLGLIAFYENPTVQWIAGGLLLVILVTVGINRKLTFNEPDDKNIYISRNWIAIGEQQYGLSELEHVGIYVDAFYGFRYRVTGAMNVKSYQSSYGMDNWMYFHAGGVKYSYRFLIPNHQSYFLLEDILAAWQYDGRSFAWKEGYGRAFIEKEMGR